ncbi:hypothetical protein KAU11_08765 [Candidatus Babeliales bacterium]|nr:hypothetical protein [Candidatus Babeliales bacterium]
MEYAKIKWTSFTMIGEKNMGDLTEKMIDNFVICKSCFRRFKINDHPAAGEKFKLVKHCPYCDCINVYILNREIVCR